MSEPLAAARDRLVGKIDFLLDGEGPIREAVVRHIDETFAALAADPERRSIRAGAHRRTDEPATFAFRDSSRRTWLALNRDGTGYHAVMPVAPNDIRVRDGLLRPGGLTCTCEAGRFRGTCRVVSAAHEDLADSTRELDELEVRARQVEEDVLGRVPHG